MCERGKAALHYCTIFLDSGRLDFIFRFQFQISSCPRGVRKEKGEEGLRKITVNEGLQEVGAEIG